MNTTPNTLFKRIRNKKGNPRGVLVAQVIPFHPEQVGIGWSLCSRKDEFDMQLGKQIAEARINEADKFLKKVPQSIKVDFAKFATRCSHYFKGQTVIGAGKFVSA